MYSFLSYRTAPQPRGLLVHRRQAPLLPGLNPGREEYLIAALRRKIRVLTRFYPISANILRKYQIWPCRRDFPPVVPAMASIATMPIGAPLYPTSKYF